MVRGSNKFWNFYIYSKLTGNYNILLDLSCHNAWSRDEGNKVIFKYITGWLLWYEQFWSYNGLIIKYKWLYLFFSCNSIIIKYEKHQRHYATQCNLPTKKKRGKYPSGHTITLLNKNQHVHF